MSSRPSGPFAPRVAMDTTLLVGANDEQILRSYLELVRNWRGSNDRTALRLRRADVLALVSILGTDSAEIERRLIAATTCTASTARRGRRLLLASLTTLSLGLLAATVTGGAAPVTGRQQLVSHTHNALAAVGAALPAATPVVAPTTLPALDEPAPGTEAIVDVPSLGIDLPVVEGGQVVIDQGVVAHYSAPGWEPPVAAGSPGTYWLAAHHLTHGGPFAGLSEIAVGAEVRVTTNGRIYVYTVTGTEVVGLLPGDDAIYGTDPTAAVILLQTCVDDTRRLLVHGVLTATI